MALAKPLIGGAFTLVFGIVWDMDLSEFSFNIHVYSMKIHATTLPLWPFVWGSTRLHIKRG